MMKADNTATREGIAEWTNEALLAEFPFLAEGALTEPTGMGRPDLESPDAPLLRGPGKARIEVANGSRWS